MMETVTSAFTVFFEGPFWVGVYERTQGGSMEACRFVFGAEPKDYEVLELLQSHWRFLKFSPPVGVKNRSLSRVNPKRLHRQIQKQTRQTGIGTKAQQAISLQREGRKLQRSAASREQKREEEKRRFSLRQEKKKEKRRGH